MTPRNLAFICYINDLNHNLESSVNTTLYADDATIIISDRFSHELQLKCDNTTKNMSNYFNSNSLYLNETKTKYLRFHQHNVKADINDVRIMLNNTILDQTNTVKFLGLTLDDKLNWTLHCNRLIGQLSKVCCLIRNVRSLLDLNHLLMIYYGQVESRLRYGICFWGMSPSAQDVSVIQKRILRTILNVSQRHSCRELFKKYNLMTVPSLYVFECCMYVHKNKTKFVKNSEVQKH